jgi:hypothetical protein
VRRQIVENDLFHYLTTSFFRFYLPGTYLTR